jgi:hypothetical protein
MTTTADGPLRSCTKPVDDPVTTPRGMQPCHAVIGDTVALLVFWILAVAAHRPVDGGLVSAVITSAMLVGGWIAGAFAFRVYRRPAALSPALLAWLFGIPLAFVLRTVVRNRPLDPVFVLVTWGLLFALLIGWRLAAAGVRRLRNG